MKILGKSLFYLTSIVYFFSATLSLAETACSHTLNQDQESMLNELIGSGSDAPESLESKVLQAIQEDQNNFCLLYGYGRFLTIKKEYTNAREYLMQSYNVSTTLDRSKYAPLNVAGFTLLMEGKIDLAFDDFSKQAMIVEFNSLPDETRRKVHNNLGLTAMRLGRYDEAMENYEIAVQLGSNIAKQNLEIAKSILSSLESKGADTPGGFAAVLSSVKTTRGVTSEINKLAEKLQKKKHEFAVFKMPNGRYSITAGVFQNYPNAQENLKLANEAGIPDAYIASLSSWERQSELEIKLK